MPRPTGKKATNLRELLQSLREMGDAALQYHLWESRLAITPAILEYPNDFAHWAARALNDDNLAERLGSVDPLDYELEPGAGGLGGTAGRLSVGFSR